MKIRQCILLNIFFTLISLFMLCCGKKSDKQINKEIVEKQAEIFVDTFNCRDAVALASLFESDGVLNNFSDNLKIPGRSNIERYFKDQFKNEKNPKFKISIDEVNVRDNNTARVLFVSDSQKLKKTFKAEYVFENGKWNLKRLLIVEDHELISHFDQLKDLSFLIGTWVDTDEDIDMITNCEWGKNKNSIIQNIDLSLLGIKQIKGKQFITWDPVRKEVRSWVFDSDGGFGVNNWDKKDGSWYVHKIFITPEGDRITETDVYTQIDDNTYTIASINREINGNSSPSIGSFTVVKKK